jgi:hypothetical protein
MSKRGGGFLAVLPVPPSLDRIPNFVVTRTNYAREKGETRT